MSKGARVTPENITRPADDEVFVFGSNLAGRHGAGAARYAAQHFGAEYGTGEGITGQCYAFPTLDADLRKRTLPELIRSRNRLYRTARMRPWRIFLLTRVGTGLAGYSDEEMAALFRRAPRNIIRPPGWGAES